MAMLRTAMASRSGSQPMTRARVLLALALSASVLYARSGLRQLRAAAAAEAGRPIP